MTTQRYSHTQTGWIQWIVGPIGLFQIGLGLFVTEPPAVGWLLVAVGALLVCLAFCFARLTLREKTDHLEVAFGPLPLFRRSIAYGRIRSFERSRSALIDGWGIHWRPGRGWIWNLQGRDCVELETTTGRLRVGTDDLEGLARHLKTRLGARRG
jgi:hypothetical protein